jgi:hypothetical protein
MRQLLYINLKNNKNTILVKLHFDDCSLIFNVKFVGSVLKRFIAPYSRTALTIYGMVVLIVQLFQYLQSA